METVSILRAVALRAPRIVVLSMTAALRISETVMTLRRFHLSHPEIPKVFWSNPSTVN